MVILREYERVAHTVHFCDECYHQINPGDFYRGSVQVWKESKRLLVFKRHVEPYCPVDPREEERELLRDMDRDSDLETEVEDDVWREAA